MTTIKDILHYSSTGKQLVLFFVVLICLSNSGLSQNQQRDARKERRKSADKYHYRTFGAAYLTFRDQATSPLYYQGPGLNLNYAWKNNRVMSNRNFELDIVGSPVRAKTPASSYFQTGTGAYYVGINGSFSYLYKINNFSGEQFVCKLGGKLIGTQNFRYNASFDNAGGGLESIANLMLSSSLNYDISRKTEKNYKFYFIKLNLLPVKREMNFQLDLGLFNFNRRPRYAYVYDNELNGSETGGLEWMFESYLWSWNGWRIQTKIELIKFRPSGNGRALAYVWELAHVPGKYEPFQMAVHRLQYSLIINNKKR